MNRSTTARILATATLGLGLATLGVALLVAPPHSTAEAQPPANSDIPSSMICRSGGKMRLDVGPRDHYLHYQLRSGPRPKTIESLKPGECASGSVDIPLGSATLPSLRFPARGTGIADEVGFAYMITAKGVGSFAGVAQGTCVSAGPHCVPDSDARAHAAEFEAFASALQKPGTVFQVQTSRDTVRGMGPLATFRTGQISYPQDDVF